MYTIKRYVLAPVGLMHSETMWPHTVKMTYTVKRHLIHSQTTSHTQSNDIWSHTQSNDMWSHTQSNDMWSHTPIHNLTICVVSYTIYNACSLIHHLRCVQSQSRTPSVMRAISYTSAKMQSRCGTSPVTRAHMEGIRGKNLHRMQQLRLNK